MVGGAACQVFETTANCIKAQPVSKSRSVMWGMGVEHNRVDRSQSELITPKGPMDEVSTFRSSIRSQVLLSTN